ncbi:MAG: AAA family ATPase [Parachlamydia sp.]|nr:AAA family ATPase [Parachlamydia sp.]
MNIQLPTHPDAERLVLGRMMNSINCANAVYENLQEEDFSLAEHRALFKAGYFLFSKDRKIDAISLLAEVQKHFPEHADISLINGLQSYSFGMTNDFMQFVEIVRDHSISRKTILFCKEMMDNTSGGKMNTEEIKNKFLADSEELFKTLGGNNSKTLTEIGAHNFKDSGKTFLEYVEWKQDQAAQGINTIEGHLTGYPLLDNCLEGFNKKHYIIIGARPGVGKTTFVLNLMKRFMQRNMKVGFFSLEMDACTVLEKFACVCSGVDHKKVSRGKGLTPDEFQGIVKAYKNIGDSIIIDDQPNLQLTQLAARAKRWVLAEGVKVIFIDYLSEVKGDGKFPNKQEEIQHVSKGIRAIAKKLNVPVVCIAQLNRQAEIGNRLPVKSDLRESGQIEADAYSIMLLHRDEEKRPGIMNVLVVKNRLGQEAAFDFSFEGSTGIIEEIGFLQRTAGANVGVPAQKEDWNHLNTGWNNEKVQ